MIKIRFFLIFLIVMFAVSGCGYTTGSLLPDNLKTIHVKDFGNKIDISTEPSDKGSLRIYRPGTEVDVTKAFIDKFIFDGSLRIVDAEEADLLLTGELVDYYKQPLRYDKFDNVEEYRIIVSVDMVLKSMAKNSVMWKEKNFIGYESYRVTGPLASNEDDARNLAIQDLADKAVEKVVEGW